MAPRDPLLLIVEDSDLVAAALKLLFEESGMRVGMAMSRQDAMTFVERQVPDAVLLDLRLPDGNGLDLLDAWRARGKLPGVIFALTGVDDPDVRERALKAGCQEVYLKPARPMQLLQRLREALRARA